MDTSCRFSIRHTLCAAWRPSRRATLCASFVLAIGLLGGISAAAAVTTWTVTTTADDAPPGTTCQANNQCLTLRDAIYSAAYGDAIQFNLTGYTLPATIQLQNNAPLNLGGKSITIHGPGWQQLSIRGDGNRVFVLPDGYVNSSPTATIDHLRITGGVMHASDGSAGSNGLNPGDAGADGGSGATAYGGCIYVGGGYTLSLEYAVVETCAAIGGKGGQGGNGATGATGGDGTAAIPAGGPGGAGGNGGNGGSGGGGLGGAIAVFGQLDLVASTLRNNIADGGPGGDAGVGGNGGTGGVGYTPPCTPLPGGGPCIPQGVGGNGGDGGHGGNGGTGGSQGWGVGGAIYAPNGFSAVNSTLVDNTAMDGLSFGGNVTGGKGGVMGMGGAGGTGGLGVTLGHSGNPGMSGSGGVGGHGGTAEGGAVFSYNTATQNLIKHTTIAFNNVRAGLPGPGANGSGPGTDGWASGGGVENQNNAKIGFWNSIIASNHVVNTAGASSLNNCALLTPAVLTTDNLSDDGSCGDVTVATSLDLAPVRDGGHSYPWGGNGMPVVMPLPGSPAINGATVTSMPGSLATGGCAEPQDERGVVRPYGLLTPLPCDLGAVQSDVIFIDGFDGAP